jgi:hypothetical protein
MHEHRPHPPGLPANSGRQVLFIVLVATVAGAVGYVLRYRWVEPDFLGALCRSSEAAWWCPLRTALIVATETNALGITALSAGIVALLATGRAALAASLAAAGIGGAGLFLYNTTLAAAGVLLAMLRSLRPGASSGQTTHLDPD